MVEKSELKAVITMPSGVFKPYAGVSTAILLFTKGSETENVWFYEMQNDGYTLDDKRNKIDKSDLQHIIAQYHNRPTKASTEAEREGFHFAIPKQEIIDNGYDLSLKKKKKEVYEEVSYENPKVIFEKLEYLEATILKGISELKELV